jgi:hypothetical protein
MEAAMDWNAAIERNREALKRVLAMLVAMAGLGSLSSPLAGEDGSARRGKAEPLAEPGEGYFSGSRATLPRRLHRAVLSLLRPAEAAARRLIIVAARGLVVALPPLRPRKPKPTSTVLRNGVGTGIVMPRHLLRQAGLSRPAPRTLALPLFDPLPRWSTRARSAASGFPRISIPGLTQPFPVPRAPSRDDLIDATRLALRLDALGRALDDLPREARRFARWRARRDAGRVRRLWPLRPGRPPGGRLSRYDPDAPRRKNIRDVDEILAHAHALASYALSPDTS